VSRLEDRLREAYQGAAATVTPGTSPDLDDLDIVSTWPARPRGRRPRRVLIPAAAAAAVAAIALLAAVILPLALGQPRPATPAPGTPVYQIVNDDFSIQVRNATSQQLTAQVELGHFFTLGGRTAGKPAPASQAARRTGRSATAERKGPRDTRDYLGE
jgi:hypothetical protein